MWDDHDYGTNNGDRTFPLKHVMRDIFLDFLGEPADTERRLDKDSPLHQDYVILTPEGLKVHFLLLDIRYAFDPETLDRFGPEQAAWLDEKFSEHPDSNLTLIASGV